MRSLFAFASFLLARKKDAHDDEETQTMTKRSWLSPARNTQAGSTTRPRGRRKSRVDPLGDTPILAAEGKNFPVVCIGASAGGLEAFRKLFEGLPIKTGMAFVLIQHLDPTHESVMAELLSRHTSTPVVQVTDGLLLECDHVYVIPPNEYLSIVDGVFRLSPLPQRQGPRLPLDFFLNSLAAEYGERAIAVILTGTGADGSIGLKAVKESGGLVIAQDPEDAAYDGMPRSAIMTGVVDLVLKLAKFRTLFSNIVDMIMSGPRGRALPTASRVKNRWARSSTSLAEQHAADLRSTKEERFCVAFIVGWLCEPSTTLMTI